MKNQSETLPWGVTLTAGRLDMAKNTRKTGPDLLALAMRRARDDVAAGRVPKRSPEVAVANASAAECDGTRRVATDENRPGGVERVIISSKRSP